ncbi:MAG TPA: isoprenylcysteine carboxylmethyltransferase family protein [Thermodesulfobacteriota bacterium]|nr:isoprenylcysteine carboxylmethyltransferase family protein [Thermodesulfobacteriota bacterium]
MDKHRLVSPILMWAIVAAGITFSFQIFPSEVLFMPNKFTSYLIIFAILYWLYFFVGAMIVHRKAPRSVHSIDKIVKEGVYQRVRHPIYSADIVLVWGIFSHWPSYRALSSVIWLTIVLFFWMRLEEKALTEKFGSDYLEYKKQAPMVVPRIRKGV